LQDKLLDKSDTTASCFSFLFFDNLFICLIVPDQELSDGYPLRTIKWTECHVVICQYQVMTGRTKVAWVPDAESAFERLCAVEGGGGRACGTEAFGRHELVESLVVCLQRHHLIL